MTKNHNFFKNKVSYSAYFRICGFSGVFEEAMLDSVVQTSQFSQKIKDLLKWSRRWDKSPV